jgi:hypothetical protein
MGHVVAARAGGLVELVSCELLKGILFTVWGADYFLHPHVWRGLHPQGCLLGPGLASGELLRSGVVVWPAMRQLGCFVKEFAHLLMMLLMLRLILVRIDRLGWVLHGLNMGRRVG